MPPNMGMSDMADVPSLVLRDISNLNYLVSDDNILWYRNADRLIQIKPCEEKIHDVLKDYMFDPNECKICAGARIVRHVVEQDKSSDIEQQPLFGDRKYSNTQPQKRGVKTNRNII